MPLPVTAGGDVVDFLEGAGLRSEDAIDLFFGPNIELAFPALAVGIQCAGEAEGAGVRRAHFPECPIDGLADADGVKGVFGLLPDVAQEVDQ